MKGTRAVCRGKFLSFILQKHGEDEGCTTERAGLEATGILRARFPMVRRTNGQGSMLVKWFRKWRKSVNGGRKVEVTLGAVEVVCVFRVKWEKARECDVFSRE